MKGDPTDMRQRLRLTLPGRWFGDEAPILDAVLSGFACVWADLYSLLEYAIKQSRVQTATDGFLELAAQDYLSDPFERRLNESDPDYRSRLLRAMRRERATRPAVIAAADAAGYDISIFEPAQPSSTGVYNGSAGLAWNKCGGWGSLQMPFESLLVAAPRLVSFESELWQNLSDTTPAGGVLWLRVISQG